MATCVSLFSPPAHARQSGIALAIVVWFIAGMSIMVAGIVAHARVDSQMTQLHVARAKAVAAGDGAIQLMMADTIMKRRGATATTAGGISSGRYNIGELEVEVMLLPAAGLIDLNSAPQEMLAALFMVGAGLGQEEARAIAGSVVKWRSPAARGIRQRAKRFDAIEDLLQVDGVSRSLLDAVRDFVVADGEVRGQMNWALAPQMLWQVYAQADPAKASAARRQARLPANLGAGSGGGVLRADAIVRYGDQQWLRRRWVARVSSPSSSLPWRMLRTEPPRRYEVPQLEGG